MISSHEFTRMLFLMAQEPFDLCQIQHQNTYFVSVFDKLPSSTFIYHDYKHNFNISFLTNERNLHVTMWSHQRVMFQFVCVLT